MDDIHQAAQLQPPDYVRLHPHNVVRHCIQGYEVPAATYLRNLSYCVSLVYPNLQEPCADLKPGLFAMHASNQLGINPRLSSTYWLELANLDLLHFSSPAYNSLHHMPSCQQPPVWHSLLAPSEALSAQLS